MENEVLNIKTNKENFFYEYLLLKKPVLEIVLSKINNGKKIKLSPKILKVFSILLYYNNLYKDLPDSEKWKQVFSEESKNIIMNALKINIMHLNTYLSILRNIKILDGKSINQAFIIYPEKSYSLTFEFNLNGHEK